MKNFLAQLSPGDLELKGQIAADFFLNPFLAVSLDEMCVRYVQMASSLQGVLDELCQVGVLCLSETQYQLSPTYEYPRELATWCLGLRGEDAELRQQAVAQTSLVRLQHALAVTQEEVSAILDIVPAGVVFVDQFGQVLKMNAMARRLLGEGGDRFDFCDHFGLNLEELLHLPIDFEIGERPPLAVTARPFSHESQEKGAVVALQDISERKNLEEQANRLREDFFSMIRHELRKPLLTVERCLAQNEVHGDALEMARQAASHLGAMVDDMLLLARLERDPVSVAAVDAVSLRSLIAGADLAYRAVAQKAGVVFTVELPDEDVVFSGDTARLNQVIGNLLDNAIKFTPQNGDVVLRGGFDQERVWISVADAGPGIPQTERDKIFGKFYQVDAGPGRQPGLGLGLAICWHIVEALGGEIAVEERPDKGSRFVVWLPLRSVEL